MFGVFLSPKGDAFVEAWVLSMTRHKRPSVRTVL
jgi:hypothetical protein